mgnify:FL=1
MLIIDNNKLIIHNTHMINLIIIIVFKDIYKKMYMGKAAMMAKKQTKDKKS